MAFKLKSGNKPTFKNMGSSPVKHMGTGPHKHPRPSDAEKSKAREISSKKEPDVEIKGWGPDKNSTGLAGKKELSPEGKEAATGVLERMGKMGKGSVVKAKNDDKRSLWQKAKDEAAQIKEGVKGFWEGGGHSMSRGVRKAKSYYLKKEKEQASKRKKVSKESGLKHRGKTGHKHPVRQAVEKVKSKVTGKPELVWVGDKATKRKLSESEQRGSDFRKKYLADKLREEQQKKIDKKTAKTAKKPEPTYEGTDYLGGESW